MLELDKEISSKQRIIQLVNKKTKQNKISIYIKKGFSEIMCFFIAKPGINIENDT
jgi:hypothetical protein